ncbi:MAG: hypothetical protein KF752_11250 [Pirellulaceae bacterium]|nr:hypothetical protein [Pirellulaceae bacterium]
MSNNPYQAPSNLPPVLGQSPENIPVPSDLQQRVSGPAIGLIVLGCSNTLFSVWGIVMAALNIFELNPITTMQKRDMERSRNQMGEAGAAFMDQMMYFTDLMNGEGTLVFNLLALVIGIGLVVAGLRMKAFRSYWLVMTFAVLGMMPCLSNCCIVGLPLGIWAIVVLSDVHVKAAFMSRA